MPGGRPTKYTPELASRICELVATHDMGLPRLCKKYELPDEETIRRWMYKYPEFRGKYAQAKIEQADLLAEQCLEIADDSSRDAKENAEGHENFNSEFVARSRLRIDTRKWLASKLLPKQYGEAKQIEDLTNQNDAMRAELIELRKQLEEQARREY